MTSDAEASETASEAVLRALYVRRRLTAVELTAVTGLPEPEVLAALDDLTQDRHARRRGVVVDGGRRLQTWSLPRGTPR